MRVFRHFRLVSTALALSLPAASVAQVQMVQPLNPLADDLATEMRLLAANPLDINALVRAGELALKLSDPTAAAALFARAEKLDPRNPRIKAGMGSLLVQAERPGEALRRFGEAETLGLDPRGYAADRGLAYDLIGDQGRAQRDYRLALKDGSNDETVRRYALSLGISGKRDMALQQLDPLLRRSDRGAWRARAFILAMMGDESGAERIATNMMPPGMAQGLQPFFERLSGLAPIDRAFAVHFGELRPTPERIADARLAPVLTPLPPEPSTAVAATAPAPVQAAPVKLTREERRKLKKKRGQPAPIQVAAAPPVPVPDPLPQPPVYVASTEPVTQPLYSSPTPSRAPETERRGIASATSTSVPRANSFVQPIPVAPATKMASVPTRERPPTEADTKMPGSSSGSSSQSVSLANAREALRHAPAPTAAPVAMAAAVPEKSPPQPQPQTAPAAPVAKVEAVSVDHLPAAVSPAAPAPAPAPAAPQPTAMATAATVVTPRPAPAPVRSEDSILAAIIANIAVPGSELEVASAQPARAEPASAEVATPAKVEPKPVDTAAQAKAAAEAKLAADEKAIADKKALADKKLADAKKAADAKKLADAKKAAELKKKNDPKILEPSRIWVQVAGGANEGSLPKEWEKVRAKAPAAFKGRAGWTTPLRATNRVLTGPFKTDDEARTFVNTLAKADVSAFTFTSDAGQKITKLSGK